MKATFEDIILAILQSAIQDLVNSDQNNYTLDTFTINGQLADFDNNGTVGVSDLLAFLTLFLVMNGGLPSVRIFRFARPHRVGRCAS